MNVCRRRHLVAAPRGRTVEVDVFMNSKICGNMKAGGQFLWSTPWNKKCGICRIAYSIALQGGQIFVKETDWLGLSLKAPPAGKSDGKFKHDPIMIRTMSHLKSPGCLEHYTKGCCYNSFLLAVLWADGL